MDKYMLRRVAAISALSVVASSLIIASIGRSDNSGVHYTDQASETVYTTITETLCLTETYVSSTVSATSESQCTTSTTAATSDTSQHTTERFKETIPVATKECTTTNKVTTSAAAPITTEYPCTTSSDSGATADISKTAETTTTTTTTTTAMQTDSKKPTISLTESEIKMLAALVTLEAGSEGYECQKAVASVVINRMRTSGSSLSGVIYAKGQFSVAGRVSSTKPFEISTKAVNDVVYNGTTLPIYVTYFRAGRYHSWGDQVAYTRMDNTYFSYSRALKNMYV